MLITAKQEEKFFSLPGESGGMLPQKILKIEALKSPEIAFQSNLLGNFFTITLVIFSYKMSYFYCSSLFYVQYSPIFIISQSGVKRQHSNFKLMLII